METEVEKNETVHGCIDKQNYSISSVAPKQIISASEWEKLRNAINTEEARRNQDYKFSVSTSKYYKNTYFTTLKRKIGDIISANEFNKLKDIVVTMGKECACNCAYCTCNCNYCTCHCNYCGCDCNYCTCNCNYGCTCNCNY